MRKFALLASISSVACAQAQVIYSTGFESPWSAGTNGSSVTSSANAAQGWDPGSSGATVVANGQTNAGGVTAFAGTQMLRMTTSTSSSSANWAWVDDETAWANRTTGDDVIHTSVDFFVPATNDRSSYYGLQIYNQNEDVESELFFEPNYNGTQSLIQIDDGVANGQAYAVAQSALKGTWGEFDLYADLDNATVSGTITLGGTNISLGSYPIDPSVLGAGLGDVDFFADNNGTTQTGSTAAQNSVYFDNWNVEAIAPVPEPSTYLGLGLGLGAFALIRRSRG